MADRLNPMPLVDPVHRFVLFTNAKCGGTTLKAWFFENLDFATLHWRPATLVGAFGPAYAAAHLRRGWRLARRAARAAPGSSDHKEGLRVFVTFYRRAYCSAAMAADPGADYRRICVTRHPARRLVSAYLDKFCSDEARLPFMQDVLRAVGRDAPSFRDFLGYLETVDERACNPHWRRQTYVLDGQHIDDFVRIEALHAEMTRLADVVGARRLPLQQRQAPGDAGCRGRPGERRRRGRKWPVQLRDRGASPGDRAFSADGELPHARDLGADPPDLRRGFRSARLRLSGRRGRAPRASARSPLASPGGSPTLTPERPA